MNGVHAFTSNVVQPHDQQRRSEIEIIDGIQILAFEITWRRFGSVHAA